MDFGNLSREEKIVFIIFIAVAICLFIGGWKLMSTSLTEKYDEDKLQIYTD